MPEWGLNHIPEPQEDSRLWGAFYRNIASSSTMPHVLAAKLMAVESLWNQPAIFDYFEQRYYPQAKAVCRLGERNGGLRPRPLGGVSERPAPIGCTGKRPIIERVAGGTGKPQDPVAHGYKTGRRLDDVSRSQTTAPRRRIAPRARQRQTMLIQRYAVA